MFAQQTALVADTDRREAETIARFLKDTMHFGNVVITTSGSEAKEYLRSDPISWVFSDMDFPDLSGLELLKMVRDEMGEKALPFLMISSKTDKQSLADALGAGVSDYIARPFTQSLLYEKIARQKMLMERRVSPRATPMGDYPCKLRFGNDRIQMGEIVNISMEGVLIRSRPLKGVTVYDAADIDLTLDGTKISAVGVLRRIEADPSKKGVEDEYVLSAYRLADIDETAQLQLQQFIKHHRLAEMKRKGLL